MRWISKIILKLFGWKVNGNLPEGYDRCVMIAAPHTTNWDALFVRLALFVLDVPVKIAIKNSWTRFPFNLFIEPMGGIGIDRSAKNAGTRKLSQIEGMAKLFNKHDKIALIIAPEGTRSRRDTWKMGFYHIAKMAEVPIALGYLDYKKKEAGVGGMFLPSDDVNKDMQIVYDFYKNISPKYPENFSFDKRYLPE